MTTKDDFTIRITWDPTTGYLAEIPGVCLTKRERRLLALLIHNGVLRPLMTFWDGHRMIVSPRFLEQFAEKLSQIGLPVKFVRKPSGRPRDVKIVMMEDISLDVEYS